MQVVWVEVPVTDINRAAKFYGALFDQQLEPMEYDGRKFAMLNVADGQAGLSLNQVEGFNPSADGVLVYLNAGERFDTLLSRLEAEGGKVVIPRSPMSESTVFATFNDTEGNTLALYTELSG
ncbi:MAG: VOC family protein [Chloroflexota bacterium]